MLTATVGQIEIIKQTRRVITEMVEEMVGAIERLDNILSTER